MHFCKICENIFLVQAVGGPWKSNIWSLKSPWKMVAIFCMNPDSTIHTVNKSLSQTVCPSVYQPLIQLDSQLHFCNWSNRQSISVSAIHTVIYSLLIKQSVHQSINLLYMQLASQCAVRKKMVVVHFTTIPFKPNMANYT